jgi:ubiquinone/menaquinone biosynthesis C-methylase UbiE
MSKAKNETGGSSEIQSRLWGRKARDWAEIEDEGSRVLFETVLDATNVGRGMVYLDVGCGSGLACALLSFAFRMRFSSRR